MTAPDIFRTLADPTRRAIFERLANEALMGRELSVSALKAALPVSGLVVERRDGRHAFYRAAPQGLAPLVDWIGRYRAFWPERIEKLKTVLKGMDP